MSSMLQVTLTVADVPRSVAFYRDALGVGFQGYWNPETRTADQTWTASGQPPYAEVRNGPGRVGLVPGRDGAPAGTGVELAMEVPSLDPLGERVRAAGGTAGEPVREPWGARTLAVTDPDGYRWRLLERQ
jgi:catechol 2,3-dioxygenase-like lactoylglutathione lyase family enzyme